MLGWLANTLWEREALSNFQKANLLPFEKRAEVAGAVSAFNAALIERTIVRNSPTRREIVVSLATEADQARKEALRAGAKNDSHPDWLIAATVQSWMNVHLRNLDGKLDDASLKRVDAAASEFAASVRRELSART